MVRAVTERLRNGDYALLISRRLVAIRSDAWRHDEQSRIDMLAQLFFGMSPTSGQGSSIPARGLPAGIVACLRLVSARSFQTLTSLAVSSMLVGTLLQPDVVLNPRRDRKAPPSTSGAWSQLLKARRLQSLTLTAGTPHRPRLTWALPVRLPGLRWPRMPFHGSPRSLATLLRHPTGSVGRRLSLRLWTLRRVHTCRLQRLIFGGTRG